LDIDIGKNRLMTRLVEFLTAVSEAEQAGISRPYMAVTSPSGCSEIRDEILAGMPEHAGDTSFPAISDASERFGDYMGVPIWKDIKASDRIVILATVN